MTKKMTKAELKEKLEQLLELISQTREDIEMISERLRETDILLDEIINPEE